MLSDLPTRFTYLYDFGDDWEHVVEVLGPGDDRPGLVDGEGSCPPEDVGGFHGYAEFRQAWDNPHHPDHEQFRTWAVGWKDRFDLRATATLVNQVLGVVPATVRFLLAICADGITLTPAGSLPTAVVRQAEQQFPSWRVGERPASREADLPALVTLHDVLRHVGLLRLRKGILAPIRAADDDLEVVRRLRSWFAPAGDFSSVVAVESLVLLATQGPASVDTLAERLLPHFRFGWSTGQGLPIDTGHLRHELDLREVVLQALDVIAPEKDMWSAGPSALCLLPRVAILVHQYGDG